MNRSEKLWKNAKRIVTQVNCVISQGNYLYRKEHDDDKFIIDSPFIIDEANNQIYEKNEGSRYMLWGDGWNDSIQYLRDYFSKMEVIQVQNIKKLKIK